MTATDETANSPELDQALRYAQDLGRLSASRRALSSAMSRGPGRPKILVADDDPSLILLVETTLSAGGYEVVVARDGDAAWEIVQRERPQVCLLDVQMPGLTGLNVATLIKKDETLAATRVIIVSSGARPSEVQAGLDAGADRYLTKPFSPLELLDVIDRAIRGAV